MEYEVDEKGRILIPKEVRDKLNLTSMVRLIVKDDKIIIERIDRKKVIEEYAGKYRVDWANLDLEKVYKEAVEKRYDKWSKDILT